MWGSGGVGGLPLFHRFCNDISLSLMMIRLPNQYVKNYSPVNFFQWCYRDVWHCLQGAGGSVRGGSADPLYPVAVLARSRTRRRCFGDVKWLDIATTTAPHCPVSSEGYGVVTTISFHHITSLLYPTKLDFAEVLWAKYQEIHSLM